MRTRRYSISLGIAGLVALIFVIVIMIKVIRDADLEAHSGDNPDGQTTTSQPAKPEKPPPLNQ